MDRSTSIRNMVPSNTDGKDAKDILGDSLATRTPSQSNTNETKQYVAGNPPTGGDKGGENTNK